MVSVTITLEIFKLRYYVNCALFDPFCKLLLSVYAYMYGCELWNLSCSYVNKYIVAWRKIKLRLWRLPYTTHDNIVHNLSNDVAFQLDKV